MCLAEIHDMETVTTTVLLVKLKGYIVIAYH